MLWFAQQQQQQQWLLPRLSRHLLLPSPFGRLLTGLRPFSNATPTKQVLPQQPPPPLPPPHEGAHFVVDYLVSSCGLSRTDAAKASKHLAHLKSPEKPDAVLRLLKESGLHDSHIRLLVQRSPRILVASAEKTLEPKIRALREAGFSEPELAQLVSLNPNAIRSRNTVAKIEFWRKMVGSNENVLRIVKNTNILGSSLDSKINPNLSLLRNVGMSDVDIARIIMRRPRLVLSKLSRLMSVIEQVRSLGVAPGSRMFVEALSSLFNLSQTTFEAKFKLLRSYGWSEDELLCAFQSFPVILRFSEKKISRAMDFLVKEAGYQPSYVARRSVLLGYSIDKRLIPRYYVLQFLKRKGLPGGDHDLLVAVVLPEKRFVDKYVAPFGDNVPELLETYPQVNAIINAM